MLRTNITKENIGSSDHDELMLMMSNKGAGKVIFASRDIVPDGHIVRFAANNQPPPIDPSKVVEITIGGIFHIYFMDNYPSLHVYLPGITDVPTEINELNAYENMMRDSFRPEYAIKANVTVQVSPDDFEVQTRILKVTDDSTVGEIKAWYENVRKGEKLYVQLIEMVTV